MSDDLEVIHETGSNSEAGINFEAEKDFEVEINYHFVTDFVVETNSEAEPNMTVANFGTERDSEAGKLSEYGINYGAETDSEVVINSVVGKDSEAVIDFEADEYFEIEQVWRQGIGFVVVINSVQERGCVVVNDAVVGKDFEAG